MKLKLVVRDGWALISGEGRPGSGNIKQEGIGLCKSRAGIRTTSHRTRSQCQVRMGRCFGQSHKLTAPAHGNDLHALRSLGELGLTPTPIPLLQSEGCLAQAACGSVQGPGSLCCMRTDGRTYPVFPRILVLVPHIREPDSQLLWNQVPLSKEELCTPALQGIEQPAGLLANCCGIYHHNRGMGSI